MVPADTADGSSEHRRIGRFSDAATFGAYLQNHREGRNLSLHHLAVETKIAERHLAALEQGDIRSWPGGIYRRAMVRAYAAAVGLDPDTTVSDFVLAFDERPIAITPDPSVESASLADLLAVRAGASAGLALAVCVVAIVLFAWATRPSNADDAVSADRIEPVAAIGRHADAVPASGTSGVAFAAQATNTDTRETVAAAVEPVPAPPERPVLNAERSLHIASEPAGAHVTVNGIGWGRTPVTVRHLAPGEKRVRISKDGYASAERRLALTDDDPTQNVRVTLVAQP